jgi:glucoamylase
MVPRWTSSSKSGVGTSLSLASRVWFTLGYGIVDEVYYDRLDRACIRDHELIVTDGHSFFSEEKRDTHHQISYLAPGVPAYHIVNTDQTGCYRIEKDVITDPYRSVLLQRIRFVPLQGKLEDYHLYSLLAPHINNQGYGNTARAGVIKGIPLQYAWREDTALALGSSAPWIQSSAGFVGVSDGWQDLRQHYRMTWTYDRAVNGNTALTGEIDLNACGGEFVLALGFGEQAIDAAHFARASLLDGFEAALEKYLEEWNTWQDRLLDLNTSPETKDDYRTCAAVVRVHDAKIFMGGIIASLSIPWGQTKGDNDLGGYHLVWTRDLVESVTGTFASGASHDAARILRYLQVTQEPDGHWPQNMWLDGKPYWHGIQLDEASFPILLTMLAWQEGDVNSDLLHSFWPMVRKAASYVISQGPVTQQDRWEENAGYSAFTLAVEIAALLAAADVAEVHGEKDAAEYMRETADIWNANIENWIYVAGTDLAKATGVEGYYIRIAAPDVVKTGAANKGMIQIKNRPPESSWWPASEIVSPDALALVRFGLRDPKDPRILDTVKVIDAILKVDTPIGPAWHRYNHDGYGEHANGDPYDGTGIGRAWPLLTGERAHYELAAGRREEAERLAITMAAFAGQGGMLPEQIWDTKDIPEKGLYLGRPTGSAMPLVWAHAEFLKLSRSLREQRVFDMPIQPVQRYQVDKVGTPFEFWRFNHQIPTMQQGKILRVEVLAPALVHWSADGWKTPQDLQARDTHLGLFVTDLPTDQLASGTKVEFTFYWSSAGHWEDKNYSVVVK